MSVKSPRAYAAYARDVPAGPARSGSAPDSRPLRARVAVRLRLLVRLGELPHHLLAPLVQSLEPPLLSFGERVRGEDRKTAGVIEVAHDRARELVGIDLPPAHGFGRRGPGQAARIGARVGHLEVVVMPLFADAQHFLDLRLRLQHEVLRAAAADDQDAALAAVGLRVEHDGRRLVHVRAVDAPQTLSGERLLRLV